MKKNKNILINMKNNIIIIGVIITVITFTLLIIEELIFNLFGFRKLILGETTTYTTTVAPTTVAPTTTVARG